MDLDVCEGCQRAMESVLIDRASPVFSADEDVHNPSGGGLGASWEASIADGFRWGKEIGAMVSLK